MISTSRQLLYFVVCFLPDFFSEYLRIDKLVILQLHLQYCTPDKQFPIKNTFLYISNTVIYINILSSLVPSQVLETSMGRDNWRVEKLDSRHQFLRDDELKTLPWFSLSFCAKPLASD